MYEEFLHFLEHVGKDPSHLIFEDELTGLYNRRFLYNYFEHKVAWEALEDQPLSVIMMDLDYFKQINDNYGHQAGDEALMWVAGLLKDVAGDENLPIRYAGDEFVVLVPHAGKEEASQLAERILDSVRARPLELEEPRATLRLTLSMGVASAPEDARGDKALMQKADTALYYAKKKGRNRFANVGDVAAQDVFDKTAIYQLQRGKIVGRRMQLAQVATSLKQFSKGESQFVVVEGAAGMGKTAFLETIRRNLADSKTMGHVTVQGSPHDILHPYYMTTKIIFELLNQKPDKGASTLENLESSELGYLAHILPQLAGTKAAPKHDVERELREGIFNTLVYVIPKLMDSRPLVLLVDDMHFSDEATLVLLKQLMQRHEIPLFVCGTSRDTKQSTVEGEVVPLETFCERHHSDLNIRRITLTPLTVADIADHLRSIFPQLSVPENVTEVLHKVSQGNPLFLIEILRKLALDEKITLAGQQVVVQPLEEERLPKSLEEIISQRIAALDGESRRLLHQASAMGEGIPLSVLTGSSEQMEGQILDFIDQAAHLGLVRSDFRLNDEMVRFLGKRILEIAYSTIEKDEQQNLHQRIGNYQETLYEQDLLTSPASLAYHFKRSADQTKARSYEELQTKYNTTVYNPSEAIHYTGERRRELPPPGKPLDPQSLAQIPTLIRHFLTAVRSFRLYPAGSKTLVSAHRQLKKAVDQVLAKNEHLTIFQIQNALMVNGQRIDVGDFKSVAHTLIKFLQGMELKGIAFRRGLSDRELEMLLEIFGRIKSETIDRGFWRRFTTEYQLKHIELQQVRYAIMVEAGQQARQRERPGRVVPIIPSAQVLAQAQQLDREDMSRASEVIRSLLGAARNVKLYPVKSPAVEKSLEQLMEVLRAFLTRRKVLSLGQVGNELVVNGIKLDSPEFHAVVDGFLKFLDGLSLHSLTFLDQVSAREVQTFIGALDQLPGGGPDGAFWSRFATDQGITGIFFDQILYETLVSPMSVQTPVIEPSEDPLEEFWKAQTPVSGTYELTDALSEAIPDRVTDLLLMDKEQQVQEMIRRLFHEFHSRSPSIRKKIVERSKKIWDPMTVALQHRFAKLTATQLLVAFEREKDSLLIRELAVLLHQMAISLIQLGEYARASQILVHVHGRHRQLKDEKYKHSEFLSRMLDKGLEPKTLRLVMEDFRSRELARQTRAAQLLSSLGRVTAPVLVDIIKREEELRVRQLAASLLAEMGSRAEELVKRELVLENTPEGRQRILDIIDIVSNDLKTEITFALADRHAGVRQAAFDLAERLNNEQVTELFLQYVHSQETDLAIIAIRWLGKLKPPAAVEALIWELKSSKEPERLIACCQALGQIADPASIEPLAKMAASRGFLFFRKKPDARVRAAAAYALAKIDDPRVAAVFERLTKDSDPRVQEVARTVVSGGSLAAS